jgi:hypothetical protein
MILTFCQEEAGQNFLKYLFLYFTFLCYIPGRNNQKGIKQNDEAGKEFSGCRGDCQ